MKKLLLGLSTLVVLSLSGSASELSQPKCMTAKDIENLNRGALKQVSKIKGKKNAILFLLLDPSLSAPEFKEYIIDKHFIAAMKRLRKSLFNAGIDEVIIWKSPVLGGQMGMAVPFKKGCAFSNYGEPDYLEKLILMHETYLLISKHGLDAPSVRDHVKKLLMVSRFQNRYKDKMIDKFINNIRSLTAKY